MRDQARLHLPNECCGLLVGEARVVTEIFPVSNSLASPREYFADPAELIGAFRTMRRRGLLHLGLYHSHPAGRAFPSRRDVEMAFYPNCFYFIVAPGTNLKLDVRAFTIRSGEIAGIAIQPTLEG